VVDHHTRAAEWEQEEFRSRPIGEIKRGFVRGFAELPLGQSNAFPPIDSLCDAETPSRDGRTRRRSNTRKRFDGRRASGAGIDPFRQALPLLLANDEMYRVRTKMGRPIRYEWRFNERAS
jgi:hypothetical protein